MGTIHIVRPGDSISFRGPAGQLDLGAKDALDMVMAQQAQVTEQKDSGGEGTAPDEGESGAPGDADTPTESDDYDDEFPEDDSDLPL